MEFKGGLCLKFASMLTQKKKKQKKQKQKTNPIYFNILLRTKHKMIILPLHLLAFPLSYYKVDICILLHIVKIS